MREKTLSLEDARRKIWDGFPYAGWRLRGGRENENERRGEDQAKCRTE
jgi:hypothetical protein